MVRCLIALVCVAVVALTAVAGASASRDAPIFFDGMNPSELGQASLKFNPAALAFHPDSGELYFVDHMKWIRKWEAHDRLITVASSGCAGPKATPFERALRVGALAFHPISHELYFTNAPSRICKINGRGEVVTVVGEGSAWLNRHSPRHKATVAPYALAFDEDGELYFSDGAHINKLSSDEGRVDTVAGTGHTEFNGDGSSLDSNVAPIAFAYNRRLREMFFTERSRIRRLSLGDYFVKTVAGTGHTGFNGDGYAHVVNLEPSFLDVNPITGEIYFSDGEARVRALSMHHLAAYDRVNRVRSVTKSYLSGESPESNWGKERLQPAWLAFMPRTNRLFVSDYSRVRELEEGRSASRFDVDSQDSLGESTSLEGPSAR